MDQISLVYIVAGLFSLFVAVSTIQTAWNTADAASTLRRIEKILEAKNSN